MSANRDESMWASPPSLPSSPLTILLNHPHAAPPHPVIDHKRVDVEFLVHFLNTWCGDDDRDAISFCLTDARLASTLYHRYRVRRSIKVRDLLHFWCRRFDCADKHFVPHFAQVRGSMREWSSLATHRTAWAIPCIADRHVWYLRIHRACKMPRELAITSLSILQGPFYVGTFNFLAHCLETFPSLAKLDLNETCGFATPEGEAQEDGSDADGFGGFEGLFPVDINDVHGGSDFDDDTVLVNGGWSSRFSLLQVPQLTELTLAIFTDAAGWSAIGTMLQHVPQLTSLCLRSSWMYDAACELFAPFLHQAPQLLKLDLSNNKFGDDGCRSFALSLRHVPRLTSLNVSSNLFGDLGCRAFATALQHVPELTSLDVSCTLFGDEGCLALAASLQHLPQLKALDVSSTDIGDEGLHALEPFKSCMAISCEMM